MTERHGDPHDLGRFLAAQRSAYHGALEELRRGRKTGHWIWFVFPQVRGLGLSSMSQHYGIGGLDEARAYLARPVLRGRLLECCDALLAHADRPAAAILGDVDAMKLRSSMTLFLRADPAESRFAAVLGAFFDGEPDARTDAILAHG